MQEVDQIDSNWLQPVVAQSGWRLTHHQRPTTYKGRANIDRTDGCAILVSDRAFTQVACDVHHFVQVLSTHRLTAVHHVLLSIDRTHHVPCTMHHVCSDDIGP
jgi:hypothetical protein